MAKHEMPKALQEQVREAKLLEDDLNKARDIIQRGLTQYVKRKIGARNRAQVENQESLYAELDEYESRDDIQEAYGYDIITETEKDRLMDMWDARENAKNNTGGKYEDRVTQMLEKAMRVIGEDCWDQIYEAKAAKRQFDEYWKNVEKENLQREWERKHSLRI